jgi:hypothetical protein
MLTLNLVTPMPGRRGKTYVSVGNFRSMRLCRLAAEVVVRERHDSGLGPCFFLVYGDGFKYRGRIDFICVVPARPAIPLFSHN